MSKNLKTHIKYIQVLLFILQKKLWQRIEKYYIKMIDVFLYFNLFNN